MSLEERFVDTALSRAVADRLGLSLGEFHRQQQKLIPSAGFASLRTSPA
ncbi:MAG: hypothetical protein M0T72_10795 [Candidatus Dormibacteraeota bacterium]|nr:hypothetical protein [Candidatus Dormibacteraeota bacterium]